MRTVVARISLTRTSRLRPSGRRATSWVPTARAFSAPLSSRRVYSMETVEPGSIAGAVGVASWGWAAPAPLARRPSHEMPRPAPSRAYAIRTTPGSTTAKRRATSGSWPATTSPPGPASASIVSNAASISGRLVMIWTGCRRSTLR